MPKRCTLLFSLILASACGGSNSTTTSPTPTPTGPRTFALKGQVTDSATSKEVSSATISIVDGPNAGLSATADASGRYEFATLQQAGFTVSATADGYGSASNGVTLTSDQIANFRIGRLYEGRWNATSPPGTGMSSIGFRVQDGRIVGFSFFFVVAAQGGIGLCSVDSSNIGVPIIRDAFSIPFSSQGFSTTVTGTFTSRSSGIGSIGRITLNRFPCGVFSFSGTTAGGDFSLSPVP